MAQFEWDPEKNRQNLAKHGISFEEAASVFDGDHLSIEDEGPYDEVREKTYGLIRGVLILCVVHTDRDDVIRIISARRATKSERNLFNAYFR
jgi:uncharacterized DUF497 family protein